ncbi:hypothetical protein [Microvirga makkahensis]|uniref:Hypervirulence associated protein TUDOR domain-containing protein n=1 Tax=Microvirga makkahensis TaxID=1128670 RepID=A0A7X3SMT5_9HYPH|nr:hypothetical protein [Microvirga makkahensis]MXQ10580.1 hypothetical protein [Microvirga makkahensis]
MRSTFHIGQLVRLSEGAADGEKGRTYCVVNIVPAGAERQPAYLIKNMTGKEKIVRPNDIKPASAHALP